MVYFYLNKYIRRSENKKSADIKEGDYYVEYKAQNRDNFSDSGFMHSDLCGNGVFVYGKYHICT